MFFTIVTCSESPTSLFKESESLQNISDGFFEKNSVLADEVIDDLIEEFDVSAMMTDEYQFTSQDKSLFSVSNSRSVTPVHSRSELHMINSENFDVDNRDTKRKSSVTPTPSEYNSFTPSPLRPLSELNQNICVLNSGRLSSMSLSNCQSPIINSNDASSAASSECSTPSSLNGRKRRQFSIDRSKKKRLRNKDKWIDTRRKLLLNSGKQHLSRNGKVQPAKRIKPACDICKFNCSSKISPEDRKGIFDRFWDLCDHEKQ